MDSFEWNKIIGAILFTLTVVVGLGIFTEILFHREPPERPGYELAGAAATAPAEEAAPAAPAEEPIAVRLASASLDKGQAAFKKCAACHSVDKDGKNGVGPNLWNVVGGPKAHRADYAYSEPLATLGKEGQSWGFEEMDKFITNPKGYIPGTKMSFAGVKNPQERADILLYLHSLSDAPVALPTP